MTASTKDALADPGYRPIRLRPGAMPPPGPGPPNAERVEAGAWLEEGVVGGGRGWRRAWLEEGSSRRELAGVIERSV